VLLFVCAIYNVHSFILAVIVLDCAGVVVGLLIVIIGAVLSIIVTSALQLHVFHAASFTYAVYVQLSVTVNSCAVEYVSLFHEYPSVI
jgi:ABC-type molybdate transport system substrate-binding protein